MIFRKVLIGDQKSYLGFAVTNYKQNQIMTILSSKMLSFYYGYVEYIRALVNDKKPKKLGWGHHFAISCDYGYRPKAYSKVFEIAKKHFPKLFEVSDWKASLLDLLGLKYSPTLKSLAYFVKNESEEKRDLFFKDLHAVA